MNKLVNEDIKVEYNNLVKNVEQLTNHVNDLDNYVNTMNEKSVSSETIVTEPTPEPISVTETTPEPISATETTPEPVTTETITQPAQPVRKEIIKEMIKEKEDLLYALTDTNKQETKTHEQLLEEQKVEMNARNTIIEEALNKMLKKKADNIKITTIFTSKITAWKLLRETNKKLNEYISTTLFYDIKRDWLTYGKILLFRPKYFLDEFLESYHELNINLGRNDYFKDIMSKYIKKNVNNPIDVSDHIFINIKTQLDDTYNGIIQMEKRGGRKTKKQRKQKKQRKSKRKQIKSHRIK